jgi:lipopolysaccharide export system protein LptC
MSGDSYSRLVGILKVALPIVALALLSTLFLLSDRIEIGSSIPFAEGEITERVDAQQVTGPVFAGATSSGDLITFKADQLVQDGSDGNRAVNVSARVTFTNGGQVAMVSDSGTFHIETDEARMKGNVLIESSTGYVMRTDLITAQLSELEVIAPGEVRATGPAGDLTAGAMEITTRGEGGNAQLLFTGGVKLVYDPKQSE